MPVQESSASDEQLSSAFLVDDPHGNRPIRAELFGLEYLENHARQLGERMKLTRVEAGRPLISHFLRNTYSLQRAQHTISLAYRNREQLGNDAEWLLDNYHIIGDALEEIRIDLPSGYYHLLPKLIDGALAGFPRVYILAHELTAHCDSSLDETNITRFIQAFQTVAPLTIGELWAVPIMLRLCLVDNLRRLAEHVVQFRAHRLKAQAWVAVNLEAADWHPRMDNFGLEGLHADWWDCYVVHLLEGLHHHESRFPDSAERLQKCLESSNQTTTDVLRREKERQAANQVSIGNCVTSLRLLSALDWPQFFERISLLEASLRLDPSGTYPNQDFTTRDQYRRVIEELARGAEIPELDVSRVVLEMAEKHDDAAVPIKKHIGYYLIDDGRPELEAKIGYRAPLSAFFKRQLLAKPKFWYFTALVTSTIIFLLGLAWGCSILGMGYGQTILMLVLAAVPVSELSIGVLNLLVPMIVPPRLLPRMDLQKENAQDAATFVVIPSLLTSPQAAANLVERLEIHYLSNTDDNLYFGLLTDFTDAESATMPEDAACLNAAVEGIKSLNRKYGEGRKLRFFLFHRNRIWNPMQECWMGWERKRGKLIEFNRFLRSNDSNIFATTVGELGSLPLIRFVITLDADTQLPREAARKLIAMMAHPLNRPVIDPATHLVVRGYGVLQPRIGLSLRGARKSLFARIYSASAGLDPYTMAVSDTYQDLFGSGSFTGKGIYDVDAFEKSTGDVFPENRILSHDLIEGNHARCGLVSDVELLDDFPSHYLAYARRENRWARGDWQIVSWLFSSVPAPEGVRRKNPLQLLERWKIFDNLRRTVVPIFMVLVLLVGWIFLPGSWWWTGFAVLIFAWPFYSRLLTWPITALRLRLRGKKSWPRIDEFGATSAQVLLSGILLLDQARRMADVICRTLYRLFISRLHLLEWETSAASETRLGPQLRNVVRAMWPTSLLSLIIAGIIWAAHPAALSAASPFLICWFLSPFISLWISRPWRITDSPLSEEQQRMLRIWSRKTWSFFETFVTEHDHFLPPDNYQEDPKDEIAHRTSPTNIGLYLLSCIAAHDLGYLSLPALLDRLEATFDTLEKIERAHGHFYNWYETSTLLPLQPIYLSTVDSGNLAVSLITLKQSLLSKVHTPYWGDEVVRGLQDTYAVARGIYAAQKKDHAAAKAPPHATVTGRLESLQSLLYSPMGGLEAMPKWLDRIGTEVSELLRDSDSRQSPDSEPKSEMTIWLGRLADLVRERREEFDLIMGGFSAIPGMDKSPSLGQIAHSSAQAPEQVRKSAHAPVLNGQPDAVDDAFALLKRCMNLSERASQLSASMDFKMLYNQERHLFAVGYNISAGRIDGAHYDLLASESALTSFLAIARGDVPKKHWFHLGRPLTRNRGSLTLLSWGGTMFEYLMPRLFLNLFSDTLLDESQRSAVAAQIRYGRYCRKPWGISECAYSAVDGQWNYQYQAFGMPGLGLKRGLGQDMVVAPYATGLAVMTHPRQAVRNYQQLQDEGAEGRYGFYEAIDYTADRLPVGTSRVIVKCFMAHHQGMSLLAMTNSLLHNPFPQRFHSEPMVRATELLLQERVPRDSPLAEPQATEESSAPSFQESSPHLSRRITTPHTAHPRIHLLASDNYSLMLTNAGSGQSMARGLAVTRWREDKTCDAYGQYFYLRDLRSGQCWSAGYQPLCTEADEYEVIFATDKVSFRRVDSGLETRTDITVSPENHAEVRRLTLTNHGLKSRYIEITSYAEVVLATQAADLAHPAFGKLFLETEYLSATEALLCKRRPRSTDEKPVWAMHVIAIEGRLYGSIQFETDRARFLGRGRTPANPSALEPNSGTLSGTTGPVLDPIFSLRRHVRIKAGASITLAFTTAVADSREQAVALADHYHDYHGINRAFELAWAHSQVDLRQLHLTAAETHLFQRLAAHLFYSGSSLRATPVLLIANRQGQPDLWRLGISGDIPIILVQLENPEELSLASQLIAAHAFLRIKGLVADLVILIEKEGSYFEDLLQQLQSLVRASEDRALLDKPGGVHLRKTSHLSADDQVLLHASARCVLIGSRGALGAQLDRLERQGAPVPVRSEEGKRAKKSVPLQALEHHDLNALSFDNGLGGFTPTGKEYVVRLKVQNDLYKLPPQPWINVISNPDFGCLVSETGGGYTWAGNSQSNRLTPWQNDPVSDQLGEIIYLRDEVTGELWSATPLPLGMPADFLVSHGQGYTTFVHGRENLIHELTIFVPPRDPVKVFRLKIRNRDSKPRKLSVAFYAEWVLGRTRERTAPYIVTEIDPKTGALLARCSFRPDFRDHVSFADVNVRAHTFTADRAEFLGRNGTFAAPAACERGTLSGKIGPALDPCAAFHAAILVPSLGELEIIFLLGEAQDATDAQRLVNYFRDSARVQKAWLEVNDFWERTLSAVTIHTPDEPLDMLFNRWLPYQVLSCRMWGRSALYQSGGAYGFRDQLQDSLALVYAVPDETRRHLLRASGRQFPEGDVQHWWHLPSEAGVRTRFSDDYLWLPFAVEHYVRVSGDRTVLDESVGFLQAPLLNPGQDEDYRVPEHSQETATVYEHCLRAIDHGLTFGSHGLPLMGTGDWNDGMNRVGSEGKGESVWTGWFLLKILRDFALICDSRGDAERSKKYRATSDQLGENLERHAWDGEWYRRAYFDNGQPLGSKENTECSIDSLTQSWAVISGAGDPERMRQAMAIVDQHLVLRDERLVLLFTPPFDQGPLQPGYIKGYIPGIRENGGQYTHAALWVAQAFALLGQGEKAVEVLDLINPILHASSPDEVNRFRLEPYVVPADVYSQPPHVGRGGWSWYTGSAAWYYRVILETLLGFEVRGTSFRLQPRIPAAWPGFSISYRYRSATYDIRVEVVRDSRATIESLMDGKTWSEEEFPLMDDNKKHEIVIRIRK